MTSTSLAAATASPAAVHAFQPMPRRGFLAGLASLPLIGGSVALLGLPSAVAEPVTRDMLASYKDWLKCEHRMLCYELARYDHEMARTLETVAGGAGHEWHFQWAVPSARGPAGWLDAPQPSTRAALVLSAVGCDWRGDEDRDARRRA